MTRLEHPFAPVVGERPRVLVLSTFPSEGSVKGGGYYGHPQNQFWRIMADVWETPWIAQLVDPAIPKERFAQVGEDPVELGWATRYTWLKMHQVALWDVVASCVRDGPSSDAQIRAPVMNDVKSLVNSRVSIGTVLLNGSTAARFFYRWGMDKGLMVDQILTLPSTSPRRAMPYAKKLAAWRRALKPILSSPSPKGL